jgi:hypothetical protein
MNSRRNSNLNNTPPLGRGGRRKGAGRKPDEFKAECARLASKKEFFAWAESVFDGEMVVPRMTKEGVVRTEADVHERGYLWEKLAAYGYNKPPQAVEVTGKDGGPLNIELVKYA